MKLDLRFSTILLVGWVLVSACQKDSTPHRRDPLAQGYQRIDRGEYTEAIEELTSLSNTDSRPEVLVALSSAYAARGGVKVAQYWGFVIGFKAPLIRSETLPVNDTVASLKKIARQSEGKWDAEDIEAFGGVLSAVAVWDLYKERIEAIPVVQGSAEKDLERAVHILARVQTPGGRLYRAILNLILFKTAALNSKEPWSGLDKVAEKALHGDARSLCNFDFVKFTNWVQPMSLRLGETLMDLMIAFPEQSKTLNAAYAEVDKIDLNLEQARAQLRQKKGCR